MQMLKSVVRKEVGLEAIHLLFDGMLLLLHRTYCLPQTAVAVGVVAGVVVEVVVVAAAVDVVKLLQPIENVPHLRWLDDHVLIQGVLHH